MAYIEREKVKELIKNFGKGAIEDGQYALDAVDDIILLASAVDLIPTVDAVEVVRCKDCKYAKKYERNDGKTGYYCQHQNCTFLYGTNWERLFEPIREANNYCSYGERKVSE